MKFILMGLVKSFTKEMGRSPNIGELNLLRREADIIQKQDTIIPFPQGGKDKISPFKPRPKPETEAEMLERMKRQNKESVARLKKKKEKDLGDKLKDYDGDPEDMAMGGLMRLKMFAGGTPLRRLLQYLAETSGKKGSQNLKDFKISDQMKFFANKQGVSADQNRIDYLEQVLESLYADKKLIQNLEPSAAKMDIENQAAQKFRKDYIDVTQGGRYDGLTSEMIDKSILETETMIKNLKTKNRKPNAMGGLAGALTKLKKKYGKNIIQKGKAPKKNEKKKLQEMFKDFNKRTKKADGGVAGTELAIKQSLEDFKRYQKAGGKLSYKDFIASGNEGVGRFFKDGGRIELAGGGAIAKLIKMLSAKSPVGRYKDYLASVKKRSIEGDFKSLAPELGAVSAGGILVNRKMKSILEEGNELQKERFLKEYIEELNNDPSYKDRPELKDKLIENYTKSLFGQKKAGGGLAYMLGEPRDGLKEGGPPNPGRRNFMKLMAGLASIPVLGKFFKPAAKVAKAAKVVPLNNTTTAMPAWFPKFVDKVMDKGVGTKIDADIMQYEVKELPGIKVTKHDDGRIYVEGQNDYSRSYDIEYQPPGYEVTDYKTGKAVKTKGDFTASEEVPVSVDMDGNADFEGEILEEVGDILTSDGRVMEEFATGTKLKTSTRGEHRVGQAEVAAENAADEAAERAAMEAEDFAEGGLAYLLGEK